jgi:hypothetical protein
VNQNTSYNSVAVSPLISDTFQVLAVYHHSDDHDLNYVIYSYDSEWSYLGEEAGNIATGTILTQTGLYASAQYDSSGVAHVAYYRNNTSGDDSVRHASRVEDGTGNCGTGAGWQCDAIASGEGVGLYASLAIDGSDVPHVAYYDAGNGWPVVASYSVTAWITSTVGHGSLDTGKYVSLAVTDGGAPHIAYHNVTSGTLRHAEWVGVGGNCGDGNAWVCSEIEVFTGTLPQPAYMERPVGIALDAGDHPVIAYLRPPGPSFQNGGDLRVTRPSLAYVGSSMPKLNCGPVVTASHTWRCDTVDAGGTGWYDGTAISLDANSAELLTIAYIDLDYVVPTHYYLKVAYQLVAAYLPLVLRSH